VHVFGPIGNTWDGEGVTARKFVEDFQAIKGDEVSLLVNSPGGSLFDGLTIYTVMAGSGKKITAKIMGVAASAASLLVMAASKIIMPKNTHMMVHKAGWVAAGNADEFRAQANVLDGLDAAMIATYAARTGKSEDDIKAMLDKGDTWMSADEAKAQGFADEVQPLVTVTALFDTEQLPEAVRAMFKPPEPEPTPAPAASLPEQIEALCTAAGLQAHAAVFALDDQLTTIDQAKAAIDQAGTVQALCKVAGMADKAGAFITARKSLPEVRAALLAFRAAEDEQAHVDTTPPADPLPTKTKPAATATFGPVAMWSTKPT
jgi:ATP-dependent Clp endopeptidase proteolytic subunit ClpP